ncbi:MAG: hypothetical protein LAT55_10020, partial [Opitutales bacterium]|nr:hypothetical protein [Opitutales bacterium]
MKLSAAQQKDLLQKEELIIAPHVQRGVMHRKRLVLKNCLTGTYLNVDEKQMEILALFRSGDVVPNVLNNLIRSSKAPALKDFYELILKAYAHQILERKEDPLPEKEISPYKVPRVPLWVLLPLLLASCVFALWSMWDFPLVFVSHWSDIGYAILLASLCLSAGHLLAGGVIRYFGGAVHRPGLSWFALPPHFSFNLRDSRLIHRGGAFFVGVARLLPFLPAIGAVQFYQPTLAVPLLLIFTLHLVPKRGLPMDQILQGLTGRVALDTLRGKIFYLQERSFLGKFADLLYEDFRYASVRTLFTVLWLTVLSLFVFFTIGEFLPQWW